MIIDLRSDTMTKPTPAMLQAMMAAPVGDDVFEEDPTVKALEERTAAMFGKEAGIFCTSGTMTNQIAIKVHTQPGHEVICDKFSHVYYYEGGGIAFNSGASVRLIDGNLGRITAAQVEEGINPDNIHNPITSLVSLENTANKGGGSCYELADMQAIREVCNKHKLILHLDGARIFNAIVAKGYTAKDIGSVFDTVSVCLSKGLGTPVGSVLVGTKEQVRKARRIRKVMGGGWRQAGILAAAGLYALDNNISRLAEDHQRARTIEAALKTLPFVDEIFPVETNIIVFRLDKSVKVEEYLQRLEQQGVKASKFGPQMVRFVTHLDFDDSQLAQLLAKLV